MLIVEANENGAVRIYPYDVLTDNFFPFIWEIDEPWNVDSFKYTDARYKTTDAPWFENAEISVSDVNEKGFTVTFPQAKVKSEYVNDYKVVIKEAVNGLTVKHKNIWSDYYLYNLHEKLTVSFDNLKSDMQYDIEVIAGSFWDTYSEPIKATVKTK